MFFGCVVISDLYLFQEIVVLNPYFIFSKNFMLSFIEKVTTGLKSLALFIWNGALFVSVASLTKLGGLAATAAIIDISDNLLFFEYDKSSSIS